PARLSPPQVEARRRLPERAAPTPGRSDEARSSLRRAERYRPVGQAGRVPSGVAGQPKLRACRPIRKRTQAPCWSGIASALLLDSNPDVTFRRESAPACL